jgi:Holliday junction resolvasome RuvABC endonuclease subunit
MPYDIAIDPGLNTGIVLFRRGCFVESLTICSIPAKYPATKTLPERRNSDSIRVIRLHEKLMAFFKHHVPFRRVAIESFQHHNSRYGAGKLLLCSQFRAAVVIAVARFGIDVIDVNKGKASKNEADLVAQRYRISMAKSKQHERDALHLAILCGFDRR